MSPLPDQAPTTSAPCACQDPQVLELAALIAEGVPQWEASLRLWGPGAEVRLAVRAAYRAAFAWLQLPPLETP